MTVAHHSCSHQAFKVIILLLTIVIICAMEALDNNIYIVTVAQDLSLPVPQASWSSVLLSVGLHSDEKGMSQPPSHTGNADVLTEKGETALN